MNPVFSASDFMDISPNQYTDVARLANNKISAILKDAPRVYSSQENEGYWQTHKFNLDTHTALIWPPSIEPIVQQHECLPKITEGEGFGVMFVLHKNRCRICDAEIEATWKRKEK